MKVAVITRHAVTNYGSLLQAIATQQVIENLGHTCEIIDYIRDDESYSQHEKTLLKRKPEWNKNFIKRTIYLALRQPESKSAGKRFENWQRKYLNLSQRYKTVEQLIEEKPEADIYMTGSDQVWGPVENGTYDSAYCLSFTQEKEKRIAYAASFGYMEMTPDLENYYTKWLSRYSYVAVREDSAVQILNNIGLNVTQVIDPTLLLDSEYWSQFTRPVKEKYVLVYQLHNDKRLGEYAKDVSKSLGIPLIRISTAFHQIKCEGKFIYCPDIVDFLSYIKYATCMITDSFHGTAFAINFNTPFVEVLPNNNTVTRNMSILRMTKLSDRILNDFGDIALASKPIDFEIANKILRTNRIKSIDILKYMIENA